MMLFNLLCQYLSFALERTYIQGDYLKSLSIYIATFVQNDKKFVESSLESLRSMPWLTTSPSLAFPVLTQPLHQLCLLKFEQPSIQKPLCIQTGNPMARADRNYFHCCKRPEEHKGIESCGDPRAAGAPEEAQLFSGFTALSVGWDRPDHHTQTKRHETH